MGFPLKSLRRLLNYRVVDAQTVEIGVAELLHAFFGIIDFKLESVKLLIALLVALFKENPLIVRLLESILHLLRGDSSSVYDLFSPLI